jgi:hypothetical protein
MPFGVEQGACLAYIPFGLKRKDILHLRNILEMNSKMLRI